MANRTIKSMTNLNCFALYPKTRNTKTLAVVRVNAFDTRNFLKTVGVSADSDALGLFGYVVIIHTTNRSQKRGATFCNAKDTEVTRSFCDQLA